MWKALNSRFRLEKGSAPLNSCLGISVKIGFNNLLTWILFLGYNVLVVWMAVRPADGVSFLIHPVDKLIHAAEFGFLCLIATQAFKSFFHNLLVRKVLLLAFLYTACLGFFTACLGFFTEFLQLYRPDRSFSLFDWLADVVGALIVVLVLFKKTSPQR